MGPSGGRSCEIRAAAAVGGAAAGELPAIDVMRCVAAAAEDDFAGEIFPADAATRFFQQLRLLAGDEFDTFRRGEVELIG